ncbi:hypothetical protein [Actinoplanes sp. NPDC048796]|uniref:hypothetical protein n=1 Tax=unclassified Actinoplanes TaxID=2626549 RepID=UPI0033D1842A
MSDSYACVIPTDPTWQPEGEAAERAEDYVRSVFLDPDGSGQEITTEFYDRITAVDAGENLSRITCPRCGADIPLEWWAELSEESEHEFDDLAVVVPCCTAELQLDTLIFDWPCGFARFEIAVLNPARDDARFADDELAELAILLGHPVRQILIHL